MTDLHALAARLVALDASDAPGVEALRGALVDLMFASEYAAVSSRLSDAVGHLGGVAARGAADPEALLAAAGKELELALGELEAGAPLPAVKHAPAPAAAETAAVVPAAVGDPAPLPLPADFDQSMLGDFLSEAQDNIESAEGSLLALEANPGDKDAVNTIFRVFHTIKGMSAFLGFKFISDLAHDTESFLSKVRDGVLAFDAVAADLALKSIDLMKALLESTRQATAAGTPMPAPAGYGAHLLRLQAAASGPPAGARLGEILVAGGKVSRAKLEAVAARQGEVPLGVALVREGAATPEEVGQAIYRQQEARIAPAAAAPAPTPAAEAGDASIRVRTDRLDRLINLVGEMVIAQSMLDQDPVVADPRHNDLLNKINQNGKIVRELQSLSMALRMVPLKATFQKVARQVRDLARKINKTVNLETAGEETEIDRTLVEVIGEMLVHMVRNSVDHGIERADVRLARGKSATGTVKLTACHAGGNVVFEISDDGNGLDRARIIAKARTNGLLTEDADPPDREVWNLIFAPGFSTAEAVTDVSGRGVGMDVVCQGLATLHGEVEIDSRAGAGSTFRIKVPLTMAITDGMVVRCGEQRFIIPTAKILMSVRPAAADLATVAGRSEMLRHHGQMLPIRRLHRLFAIADAQTDPLRALLVVLEDGSDRYALLVDELLGQVQVVAKTLGGALANIPGLAGGAILGDGRVGLIIDVAGIAAAEKHGGTGK